MSSEALPQGYDFGPPLGTTSEETRYLYGVFYKKLCQYRTQLPPPLQQKMTDTHIKGLADALLDGTVFEIVKELEDIQQFNESTLLNNRVTVVSAHKTQKMALAKKYKEELASVKQHNLPLAKKRHEKEEAELHLKLKEELKSMDQKIILELDQLVTDQQSTMQQADIPMFSVTNNPTEIQLQMHILKFIQRLSELPPTTTSH
ncbi:protein DGCR6-like [Halichondria panicea]|uniref:protein DGCR6-like n=1 Tax=Halichondria panicea TaxID=6063 RepID=UPI00312BBF89